MLSNYQKQLVLNLCKIERKEYTTNHLVDILQRVYPRLRKIDKLKLEIEVTKVIYSIN